MADTIKPAHHGWDHLPGGEDPIPGALNPWIRLRGGTPGFTTVSDSVWWPLPFSNIQYDPTLVSNGGGDFAWASVDTGDPGVNRWQITLDGSGNPAFYLYDLSARWDTTGGTATAKPSQVGMRLDPSDTTLDEIYMSADWFDSAGNEIENQVANGVMRLSGIIYVTGPTTLHPQVIQTTGDDRDIITEFFYLIRLLVSDDSGWTSEDA